MAAFNQPTIPSYLMPSESRSKQSSVCHLEQELKAAKEEADRLKIQLDETRSALKKITNEASYEKFDERRINLLKLQLIQLQRQVLQMTEAMGSRSSVLMEIENSLAWLSGKFRHYIGIDVKGAEVPVLRSDLITMVSTSESARIKLFKNIENCSKEKLLRPQMFLNSFLKPSLEEKFTMLDCCLGRTDCLNLRQVSQLESKLSRLYKELIKVREHLPSTVRTRQNLLSGHMSSMFHERERTVFLTAGTLARDCAADLLSLSLLLPCAPWPSQKKASMPLLTYDTLAPYMPSLPRDKAAKVERCVTAALRVCNHRYDMARQEAEALREEVHFHQAVYQLQNDYVLQAFDALREGYKEFELSANEVIIQPMKKLMEAYAVLKDNTSEEGLRKFLTLLKDHEQQWTEAIQKLDITDTQNQSGSFALSAFGQEFLKTLENLVLAQQTQRDKAAALNADLQQAQKQLEEELCILQRDGKEQQNIAMEVTDVKDKPAAVEAPNFHSSSQLASEFTDINSRLDDVICNQNKKPVAPNPKELRSEMNPNLLCHRLGQGGDGKGSVITKPENTNASLQPLSNKPQNNQKEMKNSHARKKCHGIANPIWDELSPFLSADSVKEKDVQTLNSEKSCVNEQGHDFTDCTASIPQSQTDQELKLANGKTNLKPSVSVDIENAKHKCLSFKPPFSVDSASNYSSSNRMERQSQAKARKYIPKLCVASQTLSLKRSGSQNH